MLRNLLKIAEKKRGDIETVSGAEIVAVVDPNPEASLLMSEMTGAKIFKTPADMAKDGGVDAIFICLPPFAHGAAERACVEAKVPFFCEKPLGLDEGFLKEIATEVEQQKILTGVGYMCRYRRTVQRVREILKGEQPVMAFGGWWGGSPGPHSWWSDRNKSGGQFHEQATHIVDLTRYFFGEAVEVYAAAAHGFNKGIPGYSLDDAVTVTIRFANGGVANLMASCSSNAGGNLFLDFHSLNHNVHFSEFNFNMTVKSKGAEVETMKGEDGIFKIEDQAFVDAVRTKDQSKVLSSYPDGVKSSMLSLASNKSLETGKPVSLLD
jgi:predicted dehydrogenase